MEQHRSKFPSRIHTDLNTIRSFAGLMISDYGMKQVLMDEPKDGYIAQIENNLRGYLAEIDQQLRQT